MWLVFTFWEMEVYTLIVGFVWMGGNNISRIDKGVTG